MLTNYIKNLISVNKTSNETIKSLEDIISKLEIRDDKDKANFGNLCLILKANRVISDATEAMLINENVVISDEGEYYQKIKNESEVPNEHKSNGDGGKPTGE